MRYQKLISEIDRLNSQDPNKVQINGTKIGKELLYSHRMLARLLSMAPDAPETLKIAVYGQHITRWKIPRKSFPENRSGYLQWRKALANYHAQNLSTLMLDAGYSEREAEQVCRLVTKKDLARDFHTQTLEDVACLVFLEYYLAPMQEKHSQEKLIQVLRKTWRKMSDRGQKLALELTYSEEQRSLIHRATNQACMD